MTSWTLALAASLRILVMPFEDATETGPESWKGAAFAEAVASHLEAGGHEVVATAERNRRLEEKGLSPEDALTRATAIVLGQELQANRVVVGVYRVGSDRLEVTARVIDLERGTTVGVLEDYDSVDAFVPLANRIAKNVFRIELDYIPGAVEACAARRDGLPAEAVEASARARLSLDGAERQRLLEQALSHEPSYAEARLQLGNILLERGKAREALAVLAAVQPQAASYREAYFVLGVAYLAVDDPGSAAEIFQNLVELEERPNFVNNLGVARLRAEDIDGAVAAFERSVELAAEEPTFLFNLGWAYWRRGRGSHALEQLEKVVTLNPVDAEAYLLLSAAARSQALSEEAERNHEVALALSPDLGEVDPSTVGGLARVSSVFFFKASEAAEEWTDADEDVVSVDRLLRAREYRAFGREDEAVQLLQRHVYQDPVAIEPRLEFAEIYRERGELAQAVGELQVVLWHDPSADAHVGLVTLYEAMGEPDLAVDHARQALAIRPDSAGARAVLDRLEPIP